MTTDKYPQTLINVPWRGKIFLFEDDWSNQPKRTFLVRREDRERDWGWGRQMRIERGRTGTLAGTV